MKNNYSTNLNRITSFDSQTIVENGIFIKHKSNEEKIILFPEIEKVFINKFKLSTLNKLGYISIPMFLIFLMLNCLPLDFLVFVALFVCIPILIKMHNYKWYQFNIHLNDNTFYKKKFFMKTKQDHINMVNLVRKEMHNVSKKDILQKNSIEENKMIEELYVYTTLSIA
jgi:hypothetical protein